MGFSQANISDQRHDRLGGDLVVSWKSTDAAGTLFQVYVGGRLMWHGTERRARLPAPIGPTTIDLGKVGATEGPLDFSGSLPAAPAQRAKLTWTGGAYLSATLAGFRIHGEPTPGAGVSYAAPIAFVPATRGAPTDGYGLGGYGAGGYGSSASEYSWTSPPLGPGTWRFAVVPVDAAGNPCAAPTTTTVAIAGPPRPPAANSVGKRLSTTYNAGTRVATLAWLASPAFGSPLDPNGPE